MLEGIIEYWYLIIGGVFFLWFIIDGIILNNSSIVNGGMMSQGEATTTLFMGCLAWPLIIVIIVGTWVQSRREKK